MTRLGHAEYEYAYESSSEYGKELCGVRYGLIGLPQKSVCEKLGFHHPTHPRYSGLRGRYAPHGAGFQRDSLSMLCQSDGFLNHMPLIAA